jgi:hypothetical protein
MAPRSAARPAAHLALLLLLLLAAAGAAARAPTTGERAARLRPAPPPLAPTTGCAPPVPCAHAPTPAPPNNNQHPSLPGGLPRALARVGPQVQGVRRVAADHRGGLRRRAAAVRPRGGRAGGQVAARQRVPLAPPACRCARVAGGARRGRRGARLGQRALRGRARAGGGRRGAGGWAGRSGGLGSHAVAGPPAPPRRPSCPSPAVAPERETPRPHLSPPPWCPPCSAALP